MATYDSLTQSEKDSVQALVNALRGICVTFETLCKQGQIVSADWNGGLSTIVQSLGSDEIIPNTSGLAGAQDMAPADVTNFAGYLIDVSDPTNVTTGGGYNTAFHRALRVKFAGINASLGA